MFSLGDDVMVNHEGDKDDGMIGTVEQIDGTRYRVYFGPQDGGGWYDESELQELMTYNTSAVAPSHWWGCA